jgi:hypothetical protein
MRPMAWSGVALLTGGALTILINAGLTPFLQSDAPDAVTAASAVFLWRQSLSALAAILLLAGAIGLYLRHADQAGRLGAIVFMITFVGSVMLFANEWCQVFFVRGLALTAPAVLEELDAAKGPSLLDLGAMIALVTFALGWILFSISMLLGSVYKRRGPILVITGFIGMPILGAFLPYPWGAIIGNAVLGAGWLVLGCELFKSERLRRAA